MSIRLFFGVLFTIYMPWASAQQGQTGKCSDPATLISAIQGSKAESPMVGRKVVVEAIVVGDFQKRDQLGGFFIQEEASDQDKDKNTSEAVFIHADKRKMDVTIGDRLRISGTVKEHFGLTQINKVKAIKVCAKKQKLLTTPIRFPLKNRNSLEAIEGMLIKLEQTMVVTDNHDLARYGELSLASERLFQPTQLVPPGRAAKKLLAKNKLKQVLLDDGSSQQNPRKIIYPAPKLSAANSVRSGDTVTGLTGIMSYGFKAYRIHPTKTPRFTKANPRSGKPTILKGNLTIASFNLYNYFNGNGKQGGFPTARGANTVEEFERQRKKLINALLAIDADIVGLLELENDGYGQGSAIASLVKGLKDKGKNYRYIDPGVKRLGRDDIALGFIYKTDRVAPTGGTAILNSRIDPTFIDSKNRPSLAQSFRLNSNSGIITLALNHFKSKGSDCKDLRDPDRKDGQGHCNKTRSKAAKALAKWLATDPTSSGDSDRIILGDLNAYAQEDPIQILARAGYHNLIEKKLGTKAYTYGHKGQFGTLDYALANDSLLKQVLDISFWPINADEPRALDYNTEHHSAKQRQEMYTSQPFRSSDHDPVIVSLKLLAEKAD